MDAMEALLTRVTVPPVKMTEPGPDAAAVRRMVEAAAAAPDHGKLEPFRFLSVRGQARERLGDLFAQASWVEGGGEAEQEKHRQAPSRAPVLLLAVARPRPDHAKIPEWEQMASAACAVQNLLLAAHALGYAAKWATGMPAASPTVAKGLGLAESERLIGVVYLGSPAVAQALPPRPGADQLLEEWSP